MGKNALSKQEYKRIQVKTLLRAKRPIEKITKDVGVSKKTVESLRRRGSQNRRDQERSQFSIEVTN